MKTTTFLLCISSLPAAACHSILATHDLTFKRVRVDTSYEYTLVRTPRTPAEEDSAVAYCSYIRDQAHGNARNMEIAGFIVGPIGLVGAAAGTAVAAKATDTKTVAIAAGSAAVGTALVGVAAYLLTSASSERTGEGLLSAALIQMRNVDPYVLTAPTGKPEQPSGPTIGPKTVEVTQPLVISRVSDQTAEHLRWQTCARILATWEASNGAADAAMAGIFGSKTGSGGAGD